MKDMDLEFISFPPKNVASEEEVKEAKANIKAAIMSYKGGLPTDLLRSEYRKITGEEIPYLHLGYNSLFHLLRDIPDIRSSRNELHEPVLIIVPNEKTKHLHDLIQNQKDPKIFRTKERSRTNRRDRQRYRTVEKSIRMRKQQLDEQRNISSSTSSTESHVAVDENMGKPFIYNNYDFEDRMAACTTPIVGTSQLIGDDYFLQLCIKYLEEPLQRKDPKSPISCGTVQSGLTIRKAINRLNKIKTMSNKLIINIGTVDIYNRQTDQEMIADYQELLSKLKSKYGYSNNQVILCTLPPLGNVGMFAENKKYFNHVSFNSWLREFSEKENYKLLDLHHEFTDENMIIDYNLFQQNARMVSGTIHPHCLWNYFGRQKAMKLLASI